MINRPKNTKALLIIIIVLVAANIAGLVFFLMNKQPGHRNYSAERKSAMVVYLKNDIGFTTQQLLEYDSIAAHHRREIQPMFDMMKKEKEKRLRYIAQFEFADTAIATAVDKTISNQQVVETKMLMHLKDIRNICNEEQRAKFDTSIYKVFSRKNDGDKRRQN